MGSGPDHGEAIQVAGQVPALQRWVSLLPARRGCCTGNVQPKRVLTDITPARRSREPVSGALTAERTEEVRARVRLIIEITARAGAYRKGLLAAAKHLSPEEAAIISDLEQHGLQVPQLRDVLRGGHVLIDDPQLYEDWRFTEVSHLRISSHHRDIDKARYPDIGMRGLVVREKLHGRTARAPGCSWRRLRPPSANASCPA